MRAARVGPAWNPGIFEGVLSVDEWTVIFSAVGSRARVRPVDFVVCG